MNRPKSGERTEAAIRPRHDPVAADYIGETANSLGDQLGMFYEVGHAVDDTGYQDLVLWYLGACPHDPFMGMTRIGRFE